MRRTFRWIVTLGGGILFVAAVVAWARSYWASDLLTLAVPRLSSEFASQVFVAYASGGLVVELTRDRAWGEFAGSDPLFGGNRKPFVVRSSPPLDFLTMPQNSYFGFGVRRHAMKLQAFETRGITVVVPFWFVAVSSGAVFLVGMRMIRRARAALINPTLCKSCGYDLRAGHDKCPECGGESHVKVEAANATDTPSAPTVQR